MYIICLALFLVHPTTSSSFLAPVNYVDFPTQVKQSTIKLKFNILYLNDTEIQQLNDSMVPFLEPYFNRTLYPLDENFQPTFIQVGNLLLEVLDKIRIPYNHLKPRTGNSIDSVCTINKSVLTKLHYQNLLRSIRQLTLFLPETYPPSDRTNRQSEKSKIYASVLYYVQDVLKQFLSRLDKQIYNLLNLKNYEIPDDLFYLTQECLDPNLKYSMIPLTSKIDIDNIQITIETHEFQKISTFLLYQPISILGQTLNFPNLIINDTVIKTISCPITQSHNYINCKLIDIPSNCEQALVAKNTKNILYNCPFYTTTTSSPLLTMEGIIVNSGDNIKLNGKLVSQSELPSNPQNLPYLINNKGPVDISTSTGTYHYPSTLKDRSIKLYPIKDVDIILDYLHPLLTRLSTQDIIIIILTSIIAFTGTLTVTCCIITKKIKLNKPTLQTYSASYKPNQPIILTKMKK